MHIFRDQKQNAKKYKKIVIEKAEQEWESSINMIKNDYLKIITFINGVM